jgi:tetratricopeptide (TPR) repeat protein
MFRDKTTFLLNEKASAVIRISKIIVLLFCLSLFAQGAPGKIDSLLKLLRTAGSDTAQLEILNQIGTAYRRQSAYDSSERYCLRVISRASSSLKKCNGCDRVNAYKNALSSAYHCLAICFDERGKYDSAEILFNKALLLRKETGNTKGVAASLNSIGMSKRAKGLYKEALALHLQSAELYRHINEKGGLASALNECGIVNDFLGDYPAAIKYYFEALKTYEAMADKEGIASICINIGLIYKYKEEFAEALTYYLRALELRKQLGNKRDIAASINNIGILYIEKGAAAADTPSAKACWDTATDYTLQALKIREEIGDLQGISFSLTNLGNIYDYFARVTIQPGKQKEFFNKALEYQFRALKIKEDAGMLGGVANSYQNIGVIYFSMGEYTKAKEQYNKCLPLAKKLGRKSLVASTYRALAEVCTQLKDHKGAFANYKMYVACKDSMNSEESTKKLVQSQMQYEFDKKEAKEKAAQEKRDALNAEQMKQQRLQRNYFIGGFILVLLLAIFILRSFLLKRKANRLLEEKNALIARQKHIVEEKQKEILDSIYYARRIQRALITSEKYISRNLKKLNGQ